MAKIELRGLSLQQLSDDNLPLLFTWRNSSSFLSNVTARTAVASLEDFEAELRRDFSTDRHLQFLILTSGRCVGTIYSYSYNKLDKYCFISVFTDESFQGLGFGVRASILFCKFLFEQFALYKIYFDIYQYNVQLVSLLSKRNIAIEGCFKRQHLFNGHRFDVFRFAIYPDDIFNWILHHDSK